MEKAAKPDKHKTLKIIISCLLIVVTIVACVFIYLKVTGKSSNKKEITLNQNGEASTSWNINIENMYPTKVVDYELKILGENPSDNKVVVDFEEAGISTLNKFIKLEVLVNEKSLIKEDFTYFFLNKLDFVTKGAENSIIFRYSMPESIGNEASKTESSFTLNIDITYKG